MNKSDLVAIRSMVPDDRNFIFSTFLRGLYYGDSWYSEMVKQTFMENYHKAVEFLISKPGNTVKVACLKDDPDVILGYVILSPPSTLHWVFVKRDWRGIGLAKNLVPDTITTVTHLTKVGLSILKQKHALTFNPFFI